MGLFRKWQHGAAVFLLLSFFCGFQSSTAAAAGRSVNLEKELDDARLVGRVKILAYENGYMKFVPSKQPSRHMIAKYAGNGAGKPLEYMDAKDLADPRFSGPMTSTWPAVGTEVILVLDPKMRVSLFGAIKPNYYRFWSPWADDDVPIFKCEEPAKGIPSEVHDDKRHFSYEGCVYPPKSLKEKFPFEGH